MHSANDVHALCFLIGCQFSAVLYEHVRFKTALLIAKRPFCTTTMENKQEDIVARQN